MEINAFGEIKEVMDWLLDSRIHPECNRDVLVKRLKRSWVPEKALTTPVIKPFGTGDTKARRKAREDKLEHRAKMFMVAQDIRKKYNQGVDSIDLQKRYQLSKSQVEKIVTKNEWYNIHWEGTKVPPHFEETVKNLKEKKYEVGQDSGTA